MPRRGPFFTWAATTTPRPPATRRLPWSNGRPALAPYRLLALDRAALDNLAAGRFARALELYDAEVPLLDAATGAFAERNRFVVRVSRAAAALGDRQPARAVDNLAYVERHLADPKFVATLQWAHAAAEDVLRSYRLIAIGLRANADGQLGRLDAEAQAIAERRAIVAAQFTKTSRSEFERDAMLAEAQLAINASERRDVAATGSWLAKALAHADDLHGRANGALGKDQLDVLWLAADLTVSMGLTGRPLIPDLPRRLDAASTEMATRREPALRAYQRWFEIYGPLTRP